MSSANALGSGARPKRAPMFVEFRRSDGEGGSIPFDKFQRLIAGTVSVDGLPPEVGVLLNVVRAPDYSVRVALATHEECRTHVFSYRGAEGAALVAVKRGLLRLLPAQRPFLAADLAGSINLRPQPDAFQAARPTSVQVISDLTSVDRDRRGQALDDVRTELAWRISVESDQRLAPIVAAETRDGLLVAADDGERLEPQTSTRVFRKLVEMAAEPTRT